MSYGKVDKPQFLWAAAWYLYTAHSLMALRENPWNLSFVPPVPTTMKAAGQTVVIGGRPVRVTSSGAGDSLRAIRFDGRAAHSAVVPGECPPAGSIELELGAPSSPYLASTESVLARCSLTADRRSFTIVLKAYPGHLNRTRIVSPQRPRGLIIDGRPVGEGWTSRERASGWVTDIRFTHPSSETSLEILF